MSSVLITMAVVWVAFVALATVGGIAVWTYGIVTDLLRNSDRWDMEDVRFYATRTAQLACVLLVGVLLYVALT